MQDLHVQKHLRSGGSLDDLSAKYAISAKRHRIYENLVLLKYSQIASPMSEMIVQECRGIILDEANGWNVVAQAYRKFFNSGEAHAAPIDWSTARVQEKVDGSLLTLFHYDGRWHVATTGTADAGGPIYGLDASGTWEPIPGTKRQIPATFATYFWQVMDARGYDRAHTDADPDVCFFFELTGPLNRIVVTHSEARITLLGARNRATGQELRLAEASAMLGHVVPMVREFPLSNIEGILETFASMSPLSQEGYVVVDGAFNRIKVKHPGYVALHHAKDGLSQRAFVEIARSGETPEVIAAFPELKPMLDDAKGRMDKLVAEVEKDYSALRDIPSQKDFAMKATKTRCPAALFAVRACKSPSVREHFAGVHVDQLMRLLGYKADAMVAM